MRARAWGILVGGGMVISATLAASQTSPVMYIEGVRADGADLRVRVEGSALVDSCKRWLSDISGEMTTRHKFTIKTQGCT